MEEKDELIIEGVKIAPFDKTARGSFKEVRRATAILKTGDVNELYSLLFEILTTSGASVDVAAIALDSLSVADVEKILTARYAVKVPPLEIRPTTTG